MLIGVQHESKPGQGLDHLFNVLQVRSHRAEWMTHEPVQVLLNQATLPLQVRFESELLLNDALWVSLRWGPGRNTLLTDLSLFDNRRLTDHAHAGFLWALLEQNPGSAIWLQYRQLTPSLAQLLWQHAWMSLLGLTLTLLAAR